MESAADAPLVSLHHLHVFASVAASGGVRRSAELLFRASSAVARSVAALEHGLGVATGLSQPALNQAIGKLEDALGRPLFVRNARGLIPSDAGARWLVRFERVLAELRHIRSDVAALAGVLEGVVTVGALPLARTELLPAAIAALLARHPRLRVRSLESPYEELCAGLLSGRIDFIVGALRPEVGSDLATEFLFDDPIALIAAAGHPLAGRGPLTLASLGGYPWVLSRAGTPPRAALEHFFSAHGHPPPRPSAETGDLALLRGLLMKSEMLTVLSARQLSYEIGAGLLVALPLPLPNLGRPIGITSRGGAQMSAGAAELQRYLRGAASA